jgi:hypothetical protein
VLSWPRLAAIAALIVLMPVGFAVPMLALGVAAWDTLDHRETMPPEQESIT